jgi:hypothetical protein
MLHVVTVVVLPSGLFVSRIDTASSFVSSLRYCQLLPVTVSYMSCIGGSVNDSTLRHAVSGRTVVWSLNDELSAVWKEVAVACCCSIAVCL